MITEQALQEAIAECQGVRNPDSSTCIKLAAFLTIYDYMYGEQSQKEYVFESVPKYSYASQPVEQVDKINYVSNTEFSQAILGRDSNEIWSIMDELMSVLEATNSRLYNGVMRKIDT